MPVNFLQFNGWLKWTEEEVPEVWIIPGQHCWWKFLTVYWLSLEVLLMFIIKTNSNGFFLFFGFFCFSFQWALTGMPERLQLFLKLDMDWDTSRGSRKLVMKVNNSVFWWRWKIRTIYISHNLFAFPDISGPFLPHWEFMLYNR